MKNLQQQEFVTLIGFNAKVEETGKYGLHMPYIVIIIDELADLMMTASAEIADYIDKLLLKHGHAEFICLLQRSVQVLM